MQMYTFNYALILALCVEPQNLNPTYREDSRLEFFNVPLSHKIDSDPQNWGHKDYTKYLTKYYFNGVLNADVVCIVSMICSLIVD